MEISEGARGQFCSEQNILLITNILKTAFKCQLNCQRDVALNALDGLHVGRCNGLQYKYCIRKRVKNFL